MSEEEENAILIWDKYDNKYKEVVDVEVAKGLEADLYEANNRINDLLDTIKLKEEQIEYIENEYGRTIEQKDKIIDEMAEDIYDSQIECYRYFKDREDVKKYFEERCK